VESNASDSLPSSAAREGALYYNSLQKAKKPISTNIENTKASEMRLLCGAPYR